MRFMHSRAFVVLFWVLAFCVGVAGLIFGAKAGNNAAPAFSDGSGVSAGSHLLTAILGGILGALIVWAFFAALWIGLWALDRRANPYVDDEEYDSFDDLEDEDEDEDYDDDDRYDGYDDDDFDEANDFDEASRAGEGSRGGSSASSR